MTWVNIANKESGLSVRNKINTLGSDVTTLQNSVANLTGNDIDLLSADATAFGLPIGSPIETALMELLHRVSYSNMTIFKINTTDNISGLAVSGIAFTITGSAGNNLPVTTSYTTTSKGYMYVLLPFGNYTLSFTNKDIIGYDLNDISISSVSGDSYKTIGPIFVRISSYLMTTAKTYPLASYITNEKTKINISCVGGGGAGGWGAGGYNGGGGGGGGYVTNSYNVSVVGVTSITPVIGAAGAITSSTTQGGQGGTTSLLGCVAAGGYGGNAYTQATNPRNGGNGGSGGGGGANGAGQTSGAGGQNGGNGGTATTGAIGGTGSAISTYFFGNSAYELVGCGGPGWGAIMGASYGAIYGKGGAGWGTEVSGSGANPGNPGAVRISW